MCIIKTKFMKRNLNMLSYETLKYVFFVFADKVGIKTTVKAIVAAKHIKSLPDPVTRADFLKCKYFCS